MLDVVGLDPSLTHTAGFHALGKDVTCSDDLHLHGFAIKSQPDQYPHAIARLRRLRDTLAAELDAATQEHAPGLLIIEGYAYGAKCSREALGELGGIYRMVAYERGWTIVVVPPSSLKLYDAGKGAKAPRPRS